MAPSSMSPELISHSPDLAKLQEEGYELSVVGGLLLVHAVPYMTADREIAFGTLVMVLDLAGERTARPKKHLAFFVGDHPCNLDGSKMALPRRGPRPVLAARSRMVDG